MQQACMHAWDTMGKAVERCAPAGAGVQCGKMVIALADYCVG